MKKLKKDVTGFVGAGVLLGAGTTVSDKAGFDVSGLSTASEMMPSLGTAMMGGNVIRMVDKLPKPKKRRR